MIQRLVQSLLNLIYPKQCLHCSERLNDELHLLCQPCIDLMPLSDPEDHCRSCYAFLDGEPCKQCRKTPSPFFRCTAVFCTSPSAVSLAKRLEETNGTFLAQSLASFLWVQMGTLSLPQLDFLVPGADAGSKRLAKALSELLQVPYLDVIKPSSFLDGDIKMRDLGKSITEKHVGYISLGNEGIQKNMREGHALQRALPRSIHALLFLRHQHF